jgi:hypothetical protein
VRAASSKDAIGLPDGQTALHGPRGGVIRTVTLITADELRLCFCGQEDYCRLFSESSYFRDSEDSGLTLQSITNSYYFDDGMSFYCGINKNEDLVKVIKPESDGRKLEGWA